MRLPASLACRSSFAGQWTSVRCEHSAEVSEAVNRQRCSLEGGGACVRAWQGEGCSRLRRGKRTRICREAAGASMQLHRASPSGRRTSRPWKSRMRHWSGAVSRRVPCGSPSGVRWRRQVPRCEASSMHDLGQQRKARESCSCGCLAARGRQTEVDVVRRYQFWQGPLLPDAGCTCAARQYRTLRLCLKPPQEVYRRVQARTLHLHPTQWPCISGF